MKLYCGPLSPLCTKVSLALGEKGLDYERVEVPYSMREGYSPRHPEVERINPKGQVPVLVDGELELYDSTVILEYVEDRYPEPPLMPRDVADRARCRQLEAYADEVYFPDVFRLSDAQFGPLREGRAPDPAQIETARAKLAHHQQYLDRLLTGREFLVGDALSLADLANALAVRSTQAMGAPVESGLVHFGPWYERIQQRPAFAREVARMSAYSARQRAANG